MIFKWFIINKINAILHLFVRDIWKKMIINSENQILMKNFKHLFTVLLLLFSVAVNAHDFAVDGIFYNITDENNKTVEVTYKGSSYDEYSNEYTGKVEIYKSVAYNGTTYSVTSIGWNAFEGCSGLTSIEIPNSVTSIGSYAFRGCSGLKSVVIPYGVTSIGYNAFYECSGLTNVVIPYSVTSIEEYTFYECSSLTNVVIPNSITSIGYYAFYNCSALTSITIPNSVTSIGYNAFEGCSGLTSIEIPNSVTSTGKYTFYRCSGLTSVTIPNSVTSIGEGAFFDCSGLTSIVIPNSVTSIGSDAFSGCSGLTSVVIGNSVTSIGESAFYWCSGLTSIEIPNSVTSIGNFAFSFCRNLKTVINYSSLTITKGSSDNGGLGYYAAYIINAPNGLIDGDFVWYTNDDGRYVLARYLGDDTELILPTYYKGKNYIIGNYAFVGCTGLTSVTIGGNVTSIGSSVFEGCSGLTAVYINDLSVWCNIDFENYTSNPLYYAKNLYLNGKLVTELVIPNDVTEIKKYAFRGCSALTSVTIPNSVTSIADYAFMGCSGLTSVEIPNSVTSIGEGAFCNCSGLTSVEIPNSVTSIGIAAFTECSALTSVVIGNSVTSIGEEAFSDCSGLTSVTIPNSVTSIGDYAFYYCSGLTSIEIPNSLTSIADYAFGGCSGLTSVEIPTSVTSIGSWAFFGCSGLTSVEIPTSVTSIGSYAFRGCSGLTDVLIGNSVTSIGSGAFASCSGLNSIKSFIPAENLFAPGNNAFLGVDKGNCILYVPMGAKETYASTNGWNEFYNIQEFETSFCVTFIIDGELYDTVIVEYGGEITLPAEPEKEGYTFSGWSEIPETMPAEDITVEGSFEVNTYVITYLVNGEVYATDRVAYGSEIVPVAAPEKEGHTFSGWSEVPATMPAEDITVEGSFVVNYYTVTYMVDGEVYATDEVAYGSEIVLVEEPTKEGYTFSGWSEVPETMPAEDIVVEGTFTKKETGIEEVQCENGVAKTIYDLQGRKVTHPIKGIYIINGRKVVK